MFDVADAPGESGLEAPERTRVSGEVAWPLGFAHIHLTCRSTISAE
jgi:hypothetical protein